jgi:hypothetical protein
MILEGKPNVHAYLTKQKGFICIYFALNCIVLHGSVVAVKWD